MGGHVKDMYCLPIFSPRCCLCNIIELSFAFALIRAAKRAHLIAHQTGTKVVVMRDGKVVEIEPDPKMYNDI